MSGWLEKPIRGVLLDITGVLYESGDGLGTVIPGSVEAIARLKENGVPVRLVTNETCATREAVVDKLRHHGYTITVNDVFSPVPAVISVLKERKLTPHLLVHPDVINEFKCLTSTGEGPTCVVMGDADEGFSFTNMNTAFKALMAMDKPILFSLGKLLAVKASDADIDGGCATGSFMLECSADDPLSPWNGLKADSSWKAWGGLCSSPGCESGVSSPPPGWYLPSFDDTAWDNAQFATSLLEKSLSPWVDNLPLGICNPDGPGWLFRSPRFDASNRCACTMDSNNFIQKVYVDGEDVTSQVTGDLGDSNSVNSLSFACSATTLLAVQASDSKDGCSTGGFALKCSADNPLSPWNGMVADNTWKAWGADCPTPACETGVTSPPKEWFLPSFDASKWDNAAKAAGTVAAGIVGTPTGICSDKGKGWLFRTPRCTCEFNSDNYIHKVYVNGEDVTSQVSGDLNNWQSVNSLSFTCSATTRLAVQASDGDMNGGCHSGDFALKCSADDAASPWNGLIANDKWKAFGGSCHDVSDDKTGCVSGVSSPPKGWFLPSFDDSNWDNAAISPRTEAASMVHTPFGICDSNGPGWLFRSPNLAR